MNNNKDERAAVRTFYGFRRFRVPLDPRVLIGFAIVTAGLFAVGAPSAWLMVFLAAAAYLLSRYMDIRARRRFGELASKTRRIQAQDSLDAFLRIFKRTQLQLEEMRTLNEVYRFEKERDLFQEVRLEERLGELFNKSIRMWSRGTKNELQWRRVAWDDGRTEMFYNPVRVVALFLSAEAVIICDSEVNSAHFSLKESISRVMVNDIVSINFHARDEKFNLSDSEILSLAEAHKYSNSELRVLREDLEQREKRDPRYLQEEVGAWLAITQTDGRTLEFPIFSRVALYKPGDIEKRRSTVADLTEDDRTIDRMMNELNRIVTSAKQRRLA